MSTARKRISIHDYPEHLNPFSENHLTFQDRRRMLADKLRKNGTWSSKISKRLSRSVSWLEKSWLTAEESHKKPTSNSRICDQAHESMYHSKEQTNGLSKTHSYLDIRHDHENNSPNRMQIAKESEEVCPVQINNKPEPKRRKKRPAPLPPIADTKCDPNEKTEAILENNHPQSDHTPEPHITSADTRTGDQNANSAGSSAIHEVTKTCQSNSAVRPETDHEVADDGGGGQHGPSTSKCDSPAPSITSQSPHCSRLDSEEPSSVDQEAVSTPDPAPDEHPAELRTGETVATVDHNQNHIEAPQAEPEEVPEPPSAPSEADRDQIVDENDNVSCVQPAPRTAENLSMHCNGKAVSV